MNTQSSPTPTLDNADLQALVDEIAVTAGVSPTTAYELACRQHATLLQFARQWDAAIARIRRQARRRRRVVLTSKEQ